MTGPARTGPRLLSDRRTWLGLAVALGLGLGVSALLRAQPPSAPKLELTPVVLAVLTDPGSPSVGPAQADVTVVVFTDYQCPICRAHEPALQAALARDHGLRVVYKDWPILGAASVQAARLALAADRQGRYGALHDALMRTSRRLDAYGLRATAADAGIDWPRLQADLSAHGAEFDAQLARQAGEAWSLGIEGTPAYLVGLRLYKGGLDEAALARAIATARREARRG